MRAIIFSSIQIYKADPTPNAKLKNTAITLSNITIHILPENIDLHVKKPLRPFPLCEQSFFPLYKFIRLTLLRQTKVKILQLHYQILQFIFCLKIKIYMLKNLCDLSHFASNNLNLFRAASRFDNLPDGNQVGQYFKTSAQNLASNLRSHHTKKRFKSQVLV